MRLKRWGARWLARRYVRRHRRELEAATYYQSLTLHALLSQAEYTAVGKEHHFHDMVTYDDFRRGVPIRDYEGMRPYIGRIIEGEKDVLWPGRPLYFAKTSGTTSGVKYIPLTRESLPTHLHTARDVILSYLARHPESRLVDGKMIFLSGTPELQTVGGIPTGRLSGIVHHHIPAYLQRNRLPSFSVNMIDDWERKIAAIVEETLGEPMTLISGIPPWLQNYFEALLERTGKRTVKEVFPSLEVVIHGGVNFEPYRAVLTEMVGPGVEWIETYPASEGFIAYQDTADPEAGLFLNVNAGMFYEFIPLDRLDQPRPPRYSIDNVAPGVHYAVIINSNAGLWGYLLGDTVRFTSLDPFRIRVTGRTHHYISAFGEHVIAEEVEEAMTSAARAFGFRLREFHVAPYVPATSGEKPRYDWFLELEGGAATDVAALARYLHRALADRNIYYADLMRGEILDVPRIYLLPEGAFTQYLKQTGKLGGQNKPPRLANRRAVADALLDLLPSNQAHG